MKRALTIAAVLLALGVAGCATMQTVLNILAYEPTISCFQLAPTKSGAYYCDGNQCQAGTESCANGDTNCSCTEAP